MVSQAHKQRAFARFASVYILPLLNCKPGAVVPRPLVVGGDVGALRRLEGGGSGWGKVAEAIGVSI